MVVTPQYRIHTRAVGLESTLKSGTSNPGMGPFINRSRPAASGDQADPPRLEFQTPPTHRAMSTIFDTVVMSSMLDTMNTDDCPFLETSFEEKSVWIQLAGMVLVLGGYFAIAGTMLARDATTIAPFIPLFIIATILMVVVFAAGHAVAAMAGRPESRDERDRLISWRAEARSAWVLGAGVIVAIGCMAISMSTAWIANILILSMFLSQVLCLTLQIISYRRGF